MNQQSTVSLKQVRIDDVYWNRYTKLISEKVIPYQWDILNDRVPNAPPSYSLRNFRIAAGEISGERRGEVFQDSDLAKWLEAVANSLAIHPDPELEKTADEVIDLVGRSQCADGYLNTYYTLVEKGRRWTDLTEGHELYCAGHFIEAGVAYYEATGKDRLLKILCDYADLICNVFGPAADQLHGYPGHPEIELALIKLYRCTGEKRYADMAKYFVDTRGGIPNYFVEELAGLDHRISPDFRVYDPLYAQAHIPVRKQDTAEGHAVRGTYLYCAMADLAKEYDDRELLEQCRKIWRNITEKRMFITGGIGSSGFWERFTTDYDLPNDSNYAETCASIGLALFGMRMARLTAEAAYVDTVERALYNNIRSGISMDGDRYFYVNPLEVWPDCCMPNTSRAHVKPVRQKWFDIACCPTNVARTFTSLGQYIYSVGENALYINLFIQNEASININGKLVRVSLKTDYPKSGNIKINLQSQGAPFDLFIRCPDFAEDFLIRVNNNTVNNEMVYGYCRIRQARENDEVTISFTIRPRVVYANPLVRANTGKIAIVRGPEVYCFEEADNGTNLSALYLDPETEFQEEWREDLFGGTMLIHCKGKKLVSPGLVPSFSMDTPPEAELVSLTALPYGSWCNRQSGEMIVWVHNARI